MLCIFHTCLSHSLQQGLQKSRPTFSEFPEYVKKETPSLRLNTGSVGQDPGLLLLFMSNFY